MRLAHERAQRVFVHAADLDGVDDADDRRVDRGGLLAERVAGRLALDHDQHFLADAGADRVDREQRRPRGCSSSVSGCTSSSFAPSSFLFFCVATTVPTTRQICMSAISFSLCRYRSQ